MFLLGLWEGENKMIDSVFTEGVERREMEKESRRVRGGQGGGRT